MTLPLHQLTNNQTKLWVFGGDPRRLLAKHIAERYRTGVGIVAYRGQIIANVSPRGEVTELAPPFQRVHRNKVANAPDPAECACREYADPEAGSWKDRGLREHHPYCEFKKTSHEVFNRMMLKTLQAGGSNNVRPDEFIMEEQRVLGTRGEKTGARQ